MTTKTIDFLALLSSDKRPKYLEDIYACLALPKGASYRFRYDASYLPPEVKEAISDEYIGSFDALVCFRGSFVKNGDAIVPVRWVRVNKITKVLDFYVFYFDLQDFPIFNDQFKNSSGSALTSCSKEYLSQIPQGLRNFPVLAARMGYVANGSNNKSETWLKIVRALSMHEKFSGMHFVRLVGLSDKPLLSGAGNESRFSVDAESYLNLDLEFYSEEFSENERLELSADETILRFANGRIHRLNSRYDLLPILVEARHVEADTEVDVFFKLSESPNDNGFEFSVPIKIRKPRFQFLWRMVIPTVGGLLLASRSFLGTGANSIFVGVLIVLGALLIGAGVARRK